MYLRKCFKIHKIKFVLCLKRGLKRPIIISYVKKVYKIYYWFSTTISGHLYLKWILAREE